MGIARRIAELYEVKVNALLDRAENPAELLDYSYAQQQELLRRIRRVLTEVTASRIRARTQQDQVRRFADRLRGQAEQAVAAGEEELARQALALRTATLAQADDLDAEQVTLRGYENRLSAAARRLEAKIETFRTRKEAIKAQYAAAGAITGAVLAFGGISEEMGDVGLATRRAQDKVAQLQARASALDEMLGSGRLEDVAAPASSEEIQAQLDEVSTQALVDAELARIKERLASVQEADGST